MVLPWLQPVHAGEARTSTGRKDTKGHQSHGCAVWLEKRKDEGLDSNRYALQTHHQVVHIQTDSYILRI